jgi:cytochrome c-type biogenesis protein CcsB
MSRAVKRSETVMPEIELSLPEKVMSFWPVISSVALALLFIVARANVGPRGFLYEGALTLLALICYISAATLLVTNIFVKENILNRLGLLSVILGFAFNFSGWMIRWIEAGEAEGWKESAINGIWRYFPLDNLYALTLGFTAGAAITTLVLIRKPKYSFVGALSMPIITVILALAMFMGNEINSLPPILDSYWRPIHVSVATIGYGVCLVSFGLAFAYLIKDGIRWEPVGLTVALYGVLVLCTVGNYGFRYAEYTVNLMINRSTQMIRAELPMVGPLMVVTLVLLIGVVVLFLMDHFNRSESARKLGWKLFAGATAMTAITIAMLFYQLNTVQNPTAHIPSREYANFSARLAALDPPINQTPQFLQSWVQENTPQLKLSMTSNPVEFGGLIGLFVALLMISLFAWRKNDVMTSLPSLGTIDSMLYKTVGVAFPLLSLLLITGAVWANESWGRYWGWDSKEVGALVAWMAYAGFLHTRIARGWRGRRSAYFALLGFALVIFTWLGVSFLLPGLHSYAGV